MDEIATKAIIIGVSIFVTLIIITVIIFEYEQISSIYENVEKTDVSFESKLDELDKYRDSNNEFNGLDVRNTIKKYEKNNSIDICIESTPEDTCNDNINIDSLDYSAKYYSEFTENSNKYIITFIRK